MPSASSLPLSEMAQAMHNPEMTNLSSDDHAGNKDKDVKPGSPVTGDSSIGVVPGSVIKPGDPVRPGQLGADGKPLDKDGDGKMDADAVAPSAENSHNDKHITMKTKDGEDVDVEFADPRTAEIASRLLEGTADTPVSIHDAATATGLDINGNGRGIDIAEMRIGDVLENHGERGVIVNQEYVVTESGELKPLHEMLDYDHGDPKAYRIDMTELPSESAAPAEGAAEYEQPAPQHDAPPPPPHQEPVPHQDTQAATPAEPPRTAPSSDTGANQGTPTAPPPAAPQQAPPNPQEHIAPRAESSPPPQAPAASPPEHTVTPPQSPVEQSPPKQSPPAAPVAAPVQDLPEEVPYQGKPLGDE
jgi:hypothetical protein